MTVERPNTPVAPDASLGHNHARNERRTWIVIVITTTMMVGEITAGWLFGSMALIADGMHMATHAAAMLVAALAYRYSRRNAADRRFTFGTGKVGDLAGFASAVILAIVALLIATESFRRLSHPHFISLDNALAVALLGLGVNLLCALILHDGDGHAHSHGLSHSHGHSHGHGHGHGHGQGHGHSHGAKVSAGDQASAFPRPHLLAAAATDAVEMLHGNGHNHDHDHDHGHPHFHSHPHAVPQAGLQSGAQPAASAVVNRDNNHRGIYLHVLADTLTSFLAIIALMLGSQFGWLWLDSVIGIVGGIIIGIWSLQLMRSAGQVLVDYAPDADPLSERIRQTIVAGGDGVSDLRVWRIGPGFQGVALTISSVMPKPVAHYRKAVTDLGGVGFVIVEVEAPALVSTAPLPRLTGLPVLR